MKIVKMTRSYKSLNAGEQAGFEDYEADSLIAQGAATLVRVIEAAAKPEPRVELPAEERPSADSKPAGKKGA
jgi:hypothetical protein